MKRALLSIHFLLLSLGALHAQAISINTDSSNPDPSAILDVKSTDKGILIPRMTAAQRAAIATPATGLLVFDTSTGSFWFYNGTVWSNLSSSGAPATFIADTDGNTKVQTEEAPNEDIIRFDLAGTEALLLRKTGSQPRLELGGSNTLVGKNAGSAITTGTQNTATGIGTLFSNTTGSYNTATGSNALNANTTGNYNTAAGEETLNNSTSGLYNSALGYRALFANTTGSSNTAGGAIALYSNTTGYNNAAHGYRALYFNTTGFNNTAGGPWALYHNMTGFSNIAVGMGALYQNTTRSNLVAVGDSALYNNGLGDPASNQAIQNTAVGSKALFANTTGTRNSAFGFEALNQNTTGFGNTATGPKALYSNNSGIANTAIGDGALYGNTTGSSNSAGSWSALFSNTSGSYNSANGANALYSNQSGDNNTASGYAALFDNTTGSFNTALGASADVSAEDLTNATAIGARALAGASNSLVLGSIAGVNGATHSVNVGIGTTTPAEKLDVAGGIKIGNTTAPTPAAGTIRWNDATQDFEGYTGTQWKSLTLQGGVIWGNKSSTENASVTASDGAAGDEFGCSVAISGDYAVIGAYRKNSIQGKSYVFIRSGATWVQQAILTASDGAAGNRFGYSVAISGNYAVVGAFGHAIGGNLEQGKAYVFVQSGSVWTQQAMLTASDGAAYDHFGNSVAISGDYAVIGAHAKNVGGGFAQGKAYVFVRSGTAWSQQAMLTASDGAASDYFGNSIAISGSYAVVGAIFHDTGGNAEQGKAYVFVRSGTAWSQQAMLTASDGAASDYFGNSVAISGDYAVVGADHHDIGGNAEQGKAYVFVRSGTAWSQQAMLTASDGAVGDAFGKSVAISGDYAAVGADHHDIGGNAEQGKAYVFVRSGATWSQQAMLTASDGAVADLFSYSVAISGDYSVIGAFFHDTGGNDDQGKAYFFSK